MEDLRRSFGIIEALRGVSFSVEKGEIFGVLGPDGSGKTTLLRILAGVLRASSGKVDILGLDVAADIEAAKQHTGYLPQRFSLYLDLTVSENIDFYSRLYGISGHERQQRKQRLLEFSKLGPFVDRQAKQLSGGMKQKLALSCALIHTPQVLILDEPTTGVDPISRRELWSILYDFLAEGVTIIFATPYMDEAERASRVALLHEGRILACDTPDSLRQLFRYGLVELVSTDNRRARDLLKQEFGYQNVIFFGDRLHIKVASFESGSSMIEDGLRRAGIKIVSLRKIAPGMEDVFIDAIT